MRAVTSDKHTGNPAENFLRVLDQFASLHNFSDDASAVGGYRVLTPKRKTRLAVARGPGRIRWTGSLSVLFIGGLGLAVLAGPANCPCSTAFAVAEQSSMARLGYVQNAAFVTAREFASDDAGLPTLTTAALIEPQESAVGVSPITTSALEPSRDVPTVNSDDLPAASAGRLPEKIEQVADAVPATIKLAAAEIVGSDVPPSLPVIEVETPPVNAGAAREAEHEPAAKRRSTRKSTATRAYRAPNQAGRANGKYVGIPQVARAPKWAQQMYVTPWQSRAFTYTQ